MPIINLLLLCLLLILEHNAVFESLYIFITQYLRRSLINSTAIITAMNLISFAILILLKLFLFLVMHWNVGLSLLMLILEFWLLHLFPLPISAHKFSFVFQTVDLNDSLPLRFKENLQVLTWKTDIWKFTPILRIKSGACSTFRSWLLLLTIGYYFFGRLRLKTRKTSSLPSRFVRRFLFCSAYISLNLVNLIVLVKKFLWIDSTNRFNWILLDIFNRFNNLLLLQIRFVFEAGWGLKLEHRIAIINVLNYLVMVVFGNKSLRFYYFWRSNKILIGNHYNIILTFHNLALLWMIFLRIFFNNFHRLFVLQQSYLFR